MNKVQHCGICMAQKPEICSHCMFTKLLQYNVDILPLQIDTDTFSKSVSFILSHCTNVSMEESLRGYSDRDKDHRAMDYIKLNSVLLKMSNIQKQKDINLIMDSLANQISVNGQLAKKLELLNAQLARETARISPLKNDIRTDFSNAKDKICNTIATLKNEMLVYQDRLISKTQTELIYDTFKLWAVSEMDYAGWKLSILFIPVINVDDSWNHSIDLVTLSMKNVALLTNKLAHCLQVQLPFQITEMNAKLVIEGVILLKSDLKSPIRDLPRRDLIEYCWCASKIVMNLYTLLLNVKCFSRATHLTLADLMHLDQLLLKFNTKFHIPKEQQTSLIVKETPKQSSNWFTSLCFKSPVCSPPPGLLPSNGTPFNEKYYNTILQSHSKDLNSAETQLLTSSKETDINNTLNLDDSKSLALELYRYFDNKLSYSHANTKSPPTSSEINSMSGGVFVSHSDVHSVAV